MPNRDVIARLVPALDPSGGLGYAPGTRLSDAERDYLLLIQTRLLVAPILPVLLAQTSASAATNYIGSNRIPFPFFLRGVKIDFTNISGTDENDRVDLRVTTVDTIDQAAWDAGTSIFAPFSQTFEIIPNADPEAPDLFMPIWELNTRLVARCRSTDAAATQVGSIIASITPIEAILGPLME